VLAKRQQILNFGSHLWCASSPTWILDLYHPQGGWRSGTLVRHQPKDSLILNRSTERSRTPSLRDAPRTEKQATRSVSQESRKSQIVRLSVAVRVAFRRKVSNWHSQPLINCPQRISIAD
ncbi:MAG: hypothetical protein ACYTX0_54150, partial [Nostoc sp.]